MGTQLRSFPYSLYAGISVSYACKVFFFLRESSSNDMTFFSGPITSMPKFITIIRNLVTSLVTSHNSTKRRGEGFRHFAIHRRGTYNTYAARWGRGKTGSCGDRGQVEGRNVIKDSSEDCDPTPDGFLIAKAISEDKNGIKFRNKVNK